MPHHVVEYNQYLSAFLLTVMGSRELLV